MPRTKSSNVKKRTSPSGDKTEGEKRQASEMEPELPGTSPKLEDGSERRDPVTFPGGRPFRMKLLPPNMGNPHRYKDYSPEPAGESASGSGATSGGTAAAAGGSGQFKRGTRTRRPQLGIGKRGRKLASPDHSPHRKRFAGHDKVRKFKKMRNKRHQKRAHAAKEEERSSSIEPSSADSDEVEGSSGGNQADNSSPEQEQPEGAKPIM